MPFYLEDLLKIMLALLAGGVIGLEREFRDKSAGFRTLIFIAVGSAVFTILSGRFALNNDPTRIAANIVTGIGFLGAGAILRDGLRITGLTTAATIWLTAAMGMAIGGGQYLLAIIVLVVSMVVLWIFPFFEIRIDRMREEHTYEVLCPVDFEKIALIESRMRDSGLRVRSDHHMKEGDHMRCSWKAVGSPKKHDEFLKFLFSDKDVIEFRY